MRFANRCSVVLLVLPSDFSFCCTVCSALRFVPLDPPGPAHRHGLMGGLFPNRHVSSTVGGSTGSMCLMRPATIEEYEALEAADEQV